MRDPLVQGGLVIQGDLMAQDVLLVPCFALNSADSCMQSE